MFAKKYSYTINTTGEQFIQKLKERTIHNGCSCKLDEYDFQGDINNNSFQIKSLPHSRRGLFNPVIYGKVLQNENVTDISVEIEFKIHDLFFPILWLIACFFFSLIIYNESLENEMLKNLIFILPAVLFIAVNIIFLFFAHLNFKDAQEKIESLLEEI